MADSNGIVSLEPGQGDAYIQPKSTFDPVQFSRYALEQGVRNRAAQKLKEDQRYKEVKTFMDNKMPAVKWGHDNINYFSQKIDDLNKERQAIVKKYNGRLDSPDAVNEITAVNAKNDALINEANISNNQLDFFDKALAETKKTKDGSTLPFYSPESIEGVNYWGAPDQFKDKPMINGRGEQTTVGKALEEAGGNQLKFRNDNQHLLHMKPQWNMIDRTGELINKGHLKENTNSIIQKATYGGREGTKNVATTQYDPELIQGAANTLYSEGGDDMLKQVHDEFINKLNPEDYKNFHLHAAQQYGILDKDGKENPEFTKLPQAQKDKLEKEAIAVEGYKGWFNQLHKPSIKEGDFNEKNNLPKTDKGFNPETDITWTQGKHTVDKDQIATFLKDKTRLDHPSSTPEQQKVEDANLDAVMNNPKYQKTVETLTNKLTKSYVAINFNKPGTENKTININGTDVVPKGIMRGLDGKPYFVGSARLTDPKSIFTMMALLHDDKLDKDQKETLMKKYGFEIVDLDVPENKTDVAGKLGYGESNGGVAAFDKNVIKGRLGYSHLKVK